MTTFSFEDERFILGVKENLVARMELELTTIQSPFTFKDHIFLSGGAIGSMLRGEEVNDFDIYFKTKDAMERMEYWLKNTAPDIVAEFSDNYRDAPQGGGKLITENAITLKNKIQFILKHYGTPDNVRKSFDFVHCMPYYDFATDKLYISYEQYKANLSKDLIVNNPRAVTYHREDKFRNRGFEYGNNYAIECV